MEVIVGVVIAVVVTFLFMDWRTRAKVIKEGEKAKLAMDELNQLRPKFTQMSVDRDQLRADLDKTRSDLSLSQQSAAGLKASYDELARAAIEGKAVLEQLKTDLDKSRSDLGLSQQSTSALKASYDELVKSKNESKTILDGTIVDLQTKLEASEGKVRELSDEISVFKSSQAAHSAAVAGLEKGKKDAIELLNSKNSELQTRFDALQREKNALAETVAGYEEAEDQRLKEYDRQLVVITKVREDIEKDRENEKAAKAQAEAERLQALKETWARHEKRVDEKIQQLCQRHTIEHIDKEKIPFKGKPDNCITICEEYIIFDSKSPQSDDLTHFPTYIKKAAEDVKKYATQERVRKEIYLVIPGNAAEIIDETFYDKGEYRVFVITEEALEPVFLTLKRIEDYEFADKLDPADRDSIITTLGKMAHGIKRQIQVNQFMNTHNISVLTEAENLPKEILEAARKVEKASRLNPPREGSTKVISINELSKGSSKLNQKALAQGINTEADFKEIDNVPLTKEDQE